MNAHKRPTAKGPTSLATERDKRRAGYLAEFLPGSLAMQHFATAENYADWRMAGGDPSKLSRKLAVGPVIRKRRSPS